MGHKSVNKARNKSRPKAYWQVLLCLLLVLSIATAPAALADKGGNGKGNGNGHNKSPKSPDEGQPHAQSEMIVRLVSGVTLNQDIADQFGVTILDQISDLNIYRIGYDPSQLESSEIAQIAAMPQVQYIDLNYMTQTPTANPMWQSAGFLTAYQQQYAGSLLEASKAQQISQGAGVTVAVLDTGVDATHPLLAPNLVTGYDFINNNATPADSGGGSISGHGSAVAGLVLLAAPQAKIMPLRVLDTNGQGTLWNILKAIDYAANNGAQVLNMSLGSSADTYSMRDLIAYAQSKNIVAVASAGNASANTPQYPCAITGVICVAATDSNDLLASFSNYGSFVGISAPGIALYSAYWNDGYATWSGTSMSSPLVAGGAALVKAKTPALTAAQISAKLEGAANPISSLNPRYVGMLGSGELDLYNAVK